ncbi:RNA polymerase sigma-D factor [Insulibacter thermoxylanivorax]|uniref:RNA polymerase sigma factor n=1 Tax=Insulibacter thermoxylanivorax TaxID=2749268 RepID=A0A916QEY1_9BACL|nr:FliA/WhiG family RNA polymerase sigma factor [Insulibacter thermoxylanivorax]GFR37704.1 RNA polymerase sigma-D factor [Insulibacter thermoxylanivorax]
MNVKKSSKLANLDLWKEWKEHGSLEAKNQLIESYLPLVEYVSSRMSIGLPSSISKDDLISYGIMGLIDAIDKFDLDRGLQFETYASWRIRGAIQDALRQGDWVPRSVREKAKRIEEAYGVLEQQYLRSVTDEEVCEYLGITLKEFQQMLHDVSVTTVFSLEDPIKEEDSETRIATVIDDKAPNPESALHRQYLHEMLSQAIDRLTEKERTVVSLFYFEELSLSEIAEVMSLSPSRISQLHSKALLRLKGVLANSKHQLFSE